MKFCVDDVELSEFFVVLRMNRIDEGRQALARGVEFCDQQLKPRPDNLLRILSNGNFCDWYTFQIFRREAEELLRELDGKPAIANPTK